MGEQVPPAAALLPLVCSHLLPLALKQYLGQLPNFEQRDPLAVYGRERALRGARAVPSAKDKTRGREGAKALKHSLPPPPPFCPRDQNKPADTRVPMTLVYYQDCAVTSASGICSPTGSSGVLFPRGTKPRLRLQTQNPFRVQSSALVPGVSAAIQSEELIRVTDMPVPPVNTTQKSTQARPPRQAKVSPNGEGERLNGSPADQ